MLEPSRLTGAAAGGERRVYLFLGKDWTPALRLTLDARRETLSAPNGILTFMLLVGPCEFVIEPP